MKTLKELRLAKGYSRSFVADKIGVSSAFIGQLEMGQKIGSPKTIKALAKFFKCDAGKLMEALFLNKNSTNSLNTQEPKSA